MIRSFVNWLFGRPNDPPRRTSIPIDVEPGAPLHQVIDKAIEQMPPPPPPRYTAEDLERFIAETEQPAIALTRRYPPDPTSSSTSYIGGLPRLPEDIPWPVSSATGRPLCFLAQLDCADLPRPETEMWLPTTGTIWIFVEPTFESYFDNTQEPRRNHVYYRDVLASTIAEREPPDGPPWWETTWDESDRDSKFGPKILDGNKGPLPTVFAKWPLEFAPLKTFRNDWNQNVSIYDDAATEKPDLSEPSDLLDLQRITFTTGEWDSLDHSYANLLRKAWIDAFGLHHIKVRGWHRSQPWDKQEQKPLTWLALRKFCAEIKTRLNDLAKRPETSLAFADASRVMARLIADWLAEADQHPTLSIMPSDRRDAFLKALQGIHDPEETGSILSQTSLGLTLNESVHAVLRNQIWHPDCGPAGFDSDAIALESWQHKPFTRNYRFSRDNLDGPPEGFSYSTTFHRLLGAPTTVYYNEPAPEGYVLLAEFSYDYGIDLKIGDLNSLIYWIKPMDLLEKDFSKVLITGGTGALSFNLDRFKFGETED